MKKIFVLGSVVLILAPALSADIRWADVYKAGPLKLVPDPSFGKGVDWGSFLFETFKDIAVAGDGTIFVANSRENTIHKFDPSGKKVLTFGRKGQGPGDFESPNSPSLLEEKYLVVGEYATNRRISLFGLDGKFYRLLKAERPVYGVVGLGGTTVAYISNQFEQGGSGRGGPGVLIMPKTVRVVLKDVETGAEKVIFTRTVPQKFIQIERGPTISFGDDATGGSVFMARTADGCLAVGVGNTQQVEIFDREGRKIRAFTLARAAQAATSGFISRYKKSQIEGMRKEWQKMPTLLNALKDIEGYDFSKFFEETLPIYIEMAADADGNFLFFLRPENPDEPNLAFDAYSPEGTLIAETRIEPGPFAMGVDDRFRLLSFSRTGLIGLAPLKDDKDHLPVLFRVVPGAGKR